MFNDLLESFLDELPDVVNIVRDYISILRCVFLTDFMCCLDNY